MALAPAAGRATEDEVDRWVPSGALFFDMLGQKASGSIGTTQVLGPPIPGDGCTITQNVPGGGTIVFQNGTVCPESPLQLSASSASSDTGVAPMVGGSFELMTPRLLEGWLQPRLFLHVDAIAAFGFERKLAGTGSPGPFVPPQLDPNQNDTPEQTITGQGSRTMYQVRPWLFSTGFGPAFTFNVLGRTLRLKPSFEYLLEPVDLIASVRRAVKQQQPAAKDSLQDFRLVVLTANQRETLHGLGAGLELEVDSGRLGPFVLSVFIMGRGYRYTGNLNHTMITSNEFGETAVWRYHFEPWAWRSGAGLRFRWVPE